MTAMTMYVKIRIEDQKGQNKIVRVPFRTTNLGVISVTFGKFYSISGIWKIDYYQISNRDFY